MRRVLVLGADGFIGRQIAFELRAMGYNVIASARRPSRLGAMGFTTLAADLRNPECHRPEFWRPHLDGGAHLVNAAGLLTGDATAFKAVHEAAPRAAYTALDGGHAVLISAVGIDTDTPFSAWRRKGEASAKEIGNVTILRPGLVLADTSYGGSSLIRALAAMPICRPVVGNNTARCNPIHAADLARVVAQCAENPPGAGPVEGAWEIGGPESLTLAELSEHMRRWLGLRPVPQLRLPEFVAGLLARFGDKLRIGPISTTAMAQLNRGIAADPAPLLARISVRPKPFSAFHSARPAGTQDLWHARLYLLKPVIRLALAAMWMASAALGLFLPADRFLAVFAHLGWPDGVLTLLARAGGIVDLGLAAALLLNWRPYAIGLLQLVVVAAYTLGLSVLTPALWMAPFGELLKNLPIMALILVHLALTEER